MTAVLLFPPIPVDSYLLPCDLYTFYCNSLRIPRPLFRLRSIATAVYNDACYINAIDKTLVNAASFLPSIWRHVCVVLNHIPTVINNVVIAQFVGDTYLMHSFISILLTYLNASCSLVGPILYLCCRWRLNLECSSAWYTFVAGLFWWNVTNMPIAHELPPLERSVMMLITSRLSGVSYGYF